ncbi:MAG: hypothetical protein AABX31_03230 [Nanoarchaeota archaeon]
MSFIQKIKEKKKVIIAGAALAIAEAAVFVHSRYPTAFPHIYYTATDSFTTTPTEKIIEEQFGIDYEGDSNEDRQKELAQHLQTVYDQNPALLNHCQKIVLHSETVRSSPLVKPFLDYDGLATSPGASINILNNTIEVVTHELAHLKYHRTPNKFKEKLAKIFGDSYHLEAKPVLSNKNTWIDDTNGPKDGFVVPYGATSESENVATYVPKAYNPSFWYDLRLQQSEKYLQTLTLLHEYEFISQKQFEEAKERIENNPLKDLLKILENLKTQVNVVNGEKDDSP